MEVNIYIKKRWKGSFCGTGKAVAVIEYIDNNGDAHSRQVKEFVNEGSMNELDVKICVAALRVLKKKCKVNLLINSNYIHSTVKNNWIETWEQNDWRRKDGRPLANAIHWKLFKMMMDLHKVSVEDYNTKYDEDLTFAIAREERKTWEEIIEKMR